MRAPAVTGGAAWDPPICGRSTQQDRLEASQALLQNGIQSRMSDTDRGLRRGDWGGGTLRNRTLRQNRTGKTPLVPMADPWLTNRDWPHSTDQLPLRQMS